VFTGASAIAAHLDFKIVIPKVLRLSTSADMLFTVPACVNDRARLSSTGDD